MDMKNAVKELAMRCGACSVGFTIAEEVSAGAHELYMRFISDGKHGAMGYLANHAEIRRDPRKLLETADAKSLIVCAFPYFTPDPEVSTDARFATYARGSDYHIVLRERLAPVTGFLEEHGHAVRVCIDSAPLRERYWAVQAGVGFIGVNSQLIVPGVGSYVFLATIVTDAVFELDEPCSLGCGECGRCVERCPGGAIGADGSFDARRCLSYLTIEYRGGSLPDDLQLGGCVYGCDQCQQCCPHNRKAEVTGIMEFMPRDSIAGLTRKRILEMTRPEFAGIFAGSAVKRVRLEGLKRNARHR